MANEAYILQLPPELCVRVADFLTTAELSPLRRSCKQIEANLFDSFASEFFTKRQFMIEHNSLEALAGIANHPGLAAKLSEVIISDHQLNVNDPIDGYLPRRVLMGSGHATAMLEDSFRKLPNLKVVGLRDYDGAGRLRDGHEARWRSWGWSLSQGGPPHANITSLLPMILSALGRAKASPQDLQVILRHTHLGPYSFSLPTAHLGADIMPVLHNLKSLFLVVSSAENLYHGAPWDQYDDNNTHELFLRRFLHHTSQVEHLRLNFEMTEFLAYRFLEWLGRRSPQNSPPLDLTSSIVPSAPLSHLTALDLGMAMVSGPVLIQVLCKFDLLALSLWKIWLESPGPMEQFDSWADFLLKLSTSLATSTRLKSIMIGKVNQVFWKHDAFHTLDFAQTLFAPVGTTADQRLKPPSLEEKVVYKGQYTAQSVNAWLQELASRTYAPRFHFAPPKQSLRNPHDDGNETEDSDEYNDDENEDEDMDDD